MDINIKIFWQSLDTPRKPTREDWIYHCPSCGGYIGVVGCKRIERCNKCNQKFDWKNVV